MRKLIFFVLSLHFYANIFVSVLIQSMAEGLAEVQPSHHGCFSNLDGGVGDIPIAVAEVNQLNNLKILPRLRSILTQDYFRFFQVNLNKNCPFYPIENRCASWDCHVNDCPSHDIPRGLLEPETHSYHDEFAHKYSREANLKPGKGTENEIDCDLSKLDGSLSKARQEIIADWTRHDDADDVKFCELDDDNPDQLAYFDLLKNPERYTGYRGVSANKIWNMIYWENCFNDPQPTYGESLHLPDAGHCFEKRAFYRLVSGLHSSISTHLCYRYPKSATGKQMLTAGSFHSTDLDWGPNWEEFRRRFDPEFVVHGPARLRNLYFTYLVELRALAKAAPYLIRQSYYTGNEDTDINTRLAISDFLAIVQSEGNKFDETQLFRGEAAETSKLRREFRAHFRNISRIMDCVECDKCRLWGKLQIQGMGTALKILFARDEVTSGAIDSDPQISPAFQLRRTEIVALFNAFGRLATSVGALQEFCILMSPQP